MGLAECTALAEHDAVQSSITDHATPERVVEVEDQTFEGAALLGGEQPRHQFAIHWRGGGMDFLLGAVPQNRVVPGAQPVLHYLRVERHDVRPLAVGARPQALVQHGGEPGGGAGQAMLVVAEQRLEDTRHGLLQNGAAECRARRCPVPGEAVDPFIQTPIRDFGMVGNVEAAEKMLRIEGEQDHRRLEPVKARGRVEQFLSVLTVLADICRQPKAAAQCGNPDRRKQVRDGRGGKHRQPHRLGDKAGWRLGAEKLLQPAVEPHRGQPVEPVGCEGDELCPAFGS